ncbi:lipopolysaccharide biosynthesis protein [Petrocella sp. FN5]|uniref:lipopolysaccharide biosynthesis protein n=1 Tax=Petrocella sp. FN5 TaxID=3032002 RepID=UPI0023DAEC93|nr:polysaccharide biosynthesis C-terminal domain-containing protein [Petrocella sp. FN5]MDF1617247.1 polysaccharide biosynthesis C-terminal domain-containing protein [Petrocella sp. FN5]
MKFLSLSKRIHNSSFGYLPVKIIEGIVGILTLRVYTGLFSTDIYGEYQLINPYINIVHLLLIGWIANASIRYISKYVNSDQEEREGFFSTYFVSWFLLIILASLVMIVSAFLLPGVFGQMNLPLMLAILMVLVGYSFNQNILSLLLFVDKRGLNIILLLTASIGKLLLTVLIFRMIGNTVLAILLSHGVIDITTGLVAVRALDVGHKVRFKSVSMEILTTFLRYGFPLIGLTLTMALLNFSDRYVITYYFDKSYVGIYGANYALPAAIFTMIMIGMNRSYYPNLIQAYNEQEEEKVSRLLKNGTKNYILIALPAAVGLFVIAKPLATLFLDHKYVGGSHVIGIIAFGMFFLGLTEYVNKGWELKGSTFNILQNCFIAALFNMVMNILFVGRYGYIFAAYTTLFAYLIYFALSYVFRNKAIPFILEPKVIFKIVISAFIMGGVVKSVIFWMGYSNMSTIIGIVSGGLIYFGLLYIFGELKNIKEFLKDG